MDRKNQPVPLSTYQTFEIKIIKEKQSDYLNVLEKNQSGGPFAFP
jgi:hypothetical protein